MAEDDLQPTRFTLKNGAVATLRALRPDDRDRMARAVRGLDPQTIFTRLFSYRKELTEAGLDRIMRVDAAHEVALVVTTGQGDGETIVGSCRYVVTAGGSAPSAEVAFTVEEDFHGQGIAGRLLEALATIARRRGIATFEADVLAGNPSMLRVFERSGLPMRKRREDGTVHIELALGTDR
jgi:RimJ/RimL family protein N-acetyltransferase